VILNPVASVVRKLASGNAMSFEKCRNNGGKIKTVRGPNTEFNLDKDHTIKICIDESGRTHRGHKRKVKPL